MKFLRFKHNDEIKTGYLNEEKVIELQGDILDYFNADNHKIEEDIVKSHPVDDVEITKPVDPSKVVCVGLNYKDHADELEMALPELGVVIGKDCRRVSVDEAADYIFGYTIVNDVTARDLQEYDDQWTRSKSYDTFCPIGPVIENEFIPEDKKIQSFVNGERRQDSNISNMIFSPFELLSYMSNVMTLKAGDVIATGTPPGVGPITADGTVDIKIEGIGTLSNKLIRED